MDENKCGSEMRDPKGEQQQVERRRDLRESRSGMIRHLICLVFQEELNSPMWIEPLDARSLLVRIGRESTTYHEYESEKMKGRLED